MAKGFVMKDLHDSKLVPNGDESTTKANPNSFQPDPILSILSDLATEETSRRVTIKPLTPEDKAKKCTCGHLFRYHIQNDEATYICKYNSCRLKCKGFKQAALRQSSQVK